MSHENLTAVTVLLVMTAFPRSVPLPPFHAAPVMTEGEMHSRGETPAKTRCPLDPKGSGPSKG